MPSDPDHFIRLHRAQINALHISSDNERLYSGDSEGLVCVTSTRSFRPITKWKPHTDGILGVEEWNTVVITHGRDNKLHVWTRILASQTVADVASPPSLPTPHLNYSMDVNALNYCRFSLLPSLALIALPNLVESAYVDIWSLPGRKRIHAAIGSLGSGVNPAQQGIARTGIAMSLHLYSQTLPNSSRTQLRLLAAYEDGSVALHASSASSSIEGKTWDVMWTYKLHVETVMTMAVSRDNRMALTTSADHIIGKFLLDDDVSGRTAVNRIKNAGNGSIAMREDGRVCAVGGWDGKIRLFSTKSFKPLGTLKYHREGCFALSFARSSSSTVKDTPPVEPSQAQTLDTDEFPDQLQVDQVQAEDMEDEVEELDEEERLKRERWLISGGKDTKIAIWELISFESQPG